MVLRHKEVSLLTADSGPDKIGGDDWNADHVVDTGGMLMQVASATPAVPAAGHMVLYARDAGGRALPSFIGPSGLKSILQPHFGRNRVYSWSAQGFNAAISTIGGTATSGSPVSRSTNLASFFGAIRRAGYVTAATANANSSARGFGLVFGIGTVAGAGGFHMIWRFGTSNYAADGRVFLGLGASNSAYGSISPGAMTNIIGVGYDPGDTVWSIYHNDNAGVPTKIPTGLPCNTESVDVYELAMFAPPGTAEVSYLLTRMNDDARFPTSGPGKIAADLPVNVPMQPHINVVNGASAAVAGLDFISMYIETDN